MANTDNGDEKLSIGESAKVLLTRAGKKVKGAAQAVKDSAVSAATVVAESASGAAEVVKNSAMSTKDTAVSAVKTTVDEVSSWSPFPKVSKFPTEFRQAVTRAKELNSLDDKINQLRELTELVSYMNKMREELCLQIYHECPHNKLVKVKGEEKTFSSTPAFKLCLECGLAEEGIVNNLTTSYFKMTAEAEDMPRKQAEDKVVRKFSQEEIRKLKSSQQRPSNN